MAETSETSAEHNLRAVRLVGAATPSTIRRDLTHLRQNEAAVAAVRPRLGITLVANSEVS